MSSSLESSSSISAQQLRGELAAILDLVEDNQYASAFQSLAQYRAALQRFIRERLDVAAPPANRSEHADRC